VACKKLASLAKDLLLFGRNFQEFQSTSHSRAVPDDSTDLKKGVFQRKRDLQTDMRANTPALAGKRSDPAFADVERMGLYFGFALLAVNRRRQKCT
jgi:hypothetical protein